jgi:hypothetical protein
MVVKLADVILFLILLARLFVGFGLQRNAGFGRCVPPQNVGAGLLGSGLAVGPTGFKAQQLSKFGQRRLSGVGVFAVYRSCFTFLSDF